MYRNPGNCIQMAGTQQLLKERLKRLPLNVRLHMGGWRPVRICHLRERAFPCKGSAGREGHARGGAAALVIPGRPVGPLEPQRRQGVNSGSGRLHVQRNHIRVGWVGDARP